MPVMKSTLSFFRNFSVACCATSGFCWSSTMSTSALKPPSLPFRCLIARLKPSRISTPRPAPGPESVDRKPTFTDVLAASGGMNGSPKHEQGSKDAQVFRMAHYLLREWKQTIQNGIVAYEAADSLVHYR